MAWVKEAWSSVSPSMSEKERCCLAFFRNSGRPVEKLSQPITVLPLSNSASTRLLPIKPLAPVTKTVCIFSESTIGLWTAAVVWLKESLKMGGEVCLLGVLIVSDNIYSV